MATVDDEYWEHCAAGRFMLRRCQTCGAWQYPPTTRCPNCLSSDQRWEEASGAGHIWSWVRIHQKYFPDLPVPYVVLTVQLAEGPLMISSLAEETVDRIDCGQPVEVTFRSMRGRNLPVFRIVGAEAG